MKNVDEDFGIFKAFSPKLEPLWNLTLSHYTIPTVTLNGNIVFTNRTNKTSEVFIVEPEKGQVIR